MTNAMRAAAYHGTVMHRLTGFVNSGGSIEASFTPDSKFVVGGSEDGNVHVWDATTGAHVVTHSGHKDACTAVRFNPRLGLFASVAAETVRIARVQIGFADVYLGTVAAIGQWDPDTTNVSRLSINLLLCFIPYFMCCF